jgi:hypothetical protein
MTGQPAGRVLPCGASCIGGRWAEPSITVFTAGQRRPHADHGLQGEFYAEVPLIWGLLLSLYLTWQTPILEMDHLVLAVVVTMAGAFLTRMTAVMLRMRSPAFA